MAQVFSALFFSLAAIASMLLIAGLLRREAGRVMFILLGRELSYARAPGRVRIRMRTWTRSETRRHLSPQRTAAA